MATYDELLQLVNAAAGGNATAPAPRPLPQPPAQPAAIPLPQPQPVSVTPLAEPAGLGEALMGRAGPLERFASRVPDDGIFALLDTVGTLLRGRSAFSDAARREQLNAIPGIVTEQHVKAAQDAAQLADQQARTGQMAEGNALDKDKFAQAREVYKQGIVNDRLDRLQKRIDANQTRINALSAFDGEDVRAEQKRLNQEVVGWQNAQAEIAKDAALRVSSNGFAPIGGQRAGTANNSGGTTSSDDALLDRIAGGQYPPDVLAGRMTDKKAALLGRMALLHPDFDLTRAVTDWTARNKFSATINGRQFTLLRSAQESLQKLLKPVTDANEAVRKNSGLSFSPTLNKWVLSPLAREGARGRAAQQALALRTSAATQAIEPLAQILIAGGQPTNEAFEIAKAILSVDQSTPPDVLDDQLAAVAPGMGIRDTTFRSQTPVAPGPAQPSNRRPNPNAAPDSTSRPGDIPPGAKPVR